MKKEKKFEILNYDELPRKYGKGTSKNKLIIDWNGIDKGFVFRTASDKYGKNSFEFVDYDEVRRRICIKFERNKSNISIYAFLGGEIGAILVEYKPYISDGFKILNNIKQTPLYVVWKDIPEKTVFKTEHYNYGYNEFTFLKYKDKKIYLIYNGKKYNIIATNFLNGKISRITGMVTSEFKIEIGAQFKDEKRDLVITDREYRKSRNHKNADLKWYKYTCNKCGWTEGWIEESNLLGCYTRNGNGCSCCAGSVAVLGINTIWDTDRWMCDLGMSEGDSKKYTKSTGKKIEVTCPDCGKKKKMIISSINRRKSISCTCGDGNSYISKYILSVLTQLQTGFDTEVKYDWNKYINPLKNNKLSQASVDFVLYIEKREIPLEADGGWHRKDNKMSGQTKEHSEYIDKQRDDNCLKYLGEETIRISDEGDIRNNILNSKLNELFDLSKVNWEKCEEFALKNIVKEACEYKGDNPNLSTRDIGLLIDKDMSTIHKWLKKGTKLGWCNYDPKEEMRRISSGKTVWNKKKIEIFKEDVSFGIFESMTELERQSEELFGVKLLRNGISRVCSEKRKQYKGFIFKYVDNNSQAIG